MARSNAYPDAVHSRRVRRRKRPRRLHHPFRLLCTCLVLAAMFWALCAAKTETIPLSPLEPAEQPAEDYSSLDRLELIGTFTATAYCPCVKCCGIWSEDHPSRGEDYVQKTRAGTIPEEGRTIAADWDVLPKGSEVVINGHPYIVEDTGSAVKGNHVDIFFESHEAACEFGIQQVEVYQEAAG